MSELQPISFDFAFGETDNLDNVDRTYFGSILIQLVEVGDNLFFVRDGYIQSAEIRDFPQSLP